MRYLGYDVMLWYLVPLYTRAHLCSTYKVSVLHLCPYEPYRII